MIGLRSSFGQTSVLSCATRRPQARAPAVPEQAPETVATNLIDPNPLQPRRYFQDERLAELRHACDYLGWGVLQTAERGLEKINLENREQNPATWAGMVGRGPTIAISPRRTLTRLGISSSEVRRMNAPNGVMRGSSFVAWRTTGPLSCAFIERNL